MSKRVYFVDFARSYAICLALLDHSMNDFHIWENYSFEQYAILRLFTTSATPTFLFLFGMMLELVYFPRLQNNGLEAIKPALFKRSFQCYLGFVLTSIAGVLGGYLTYKRAFATFFFAANNHFGNILKLYAILILLAIPLLLIRKKYGLKAVLIIGISYWFLYPIFSQISIMNGNISIFLSSIFGIGNGGGPSVFNSIIIVGLGMLSSSFIDRNKKYNFLSRNLVVLILLIISVSLVINQVGMNNFSENYFDNTYRNQNHPAYYLVSMSLALLTILVISILIPVGIKLKDWTKYLLVFGRNSLSAFTVANILLNLIFLHITDYKFSILAPLSFIIFMYLILFLNERLENRNKTEKAPA
jgi:hypothetical protein